MMTLSQWRGHHGPSKDHLHRLNPGAEIADIAAIWHSERILMAAPNITYFTGGTKHARKWSVG